MQGFVRIAVKTGASLVPVLSFGENNIFQVSKLKEKSAMALVQKWASALLLFFLLPLDIPCHASVPMC